MGLVISKGLTLRKGYIGTDDPDAEAYIAAVESADLAADPTAQPLETATKVAIHSFVKGAKADGFWPAIKASCILAGARTLTGALVPLAGTAPTNFNFVSGDYNRKTGLVGDGSTKYLDSNRANNADPQNSSHQALYISTANSKDPAILIGDGLVSAVGNNRIVFSTGLSANLHFDSRSGASGSVTVHPVNPTGFVAHTRSLAASAVFRVASVSTSYAMTSNTPTSTNVHVFSRQSGGIPTNARLAFYSIGESLDLALLDARVTDLINAFGAAIP
jgi:hypothetical protein